MAANYRIFIHDDGSNDNTLSIIHSYVERYPEKIEIIEGPPTGSAKDNFFYLMRKVCSICDTSNENLQGQEKEVIQEKRRSSSVEAPKYYFFCDQDDVWLDNKLEVELTALEKLEKRSENQTIPSLVWCDMKVVDDRLNEISNSFSTYSNLTPDDLELDRCIMHGKAAGCSMACNASLIKLCCELDDSSDIIMHDWALLLIAKIVGNIQYIDKPLALYRQHSKNNLGAVKEDNIQTILKIIGRVLTLQQLKVTQTNLKRYIAQVAALKQITYVYHVQQELIDGANEFISMNRLDRVYYVNKFRLYRHKKTKLWSSVAALMM